VGDTKVDSVSFCLCPLPLQHHLKLSAEDAGEKVARAPEAAASGLHKVGKAVSGVAHHIADSARHTAHNLADHKSVYDQESYDQEMKVGGGVPQQVWGGGWVCSILMLIEQRIGSS
jgi:hypothetical protein